MRLRRVRVERKWEDAWMGAFWRRGPRTLDVWVCLIPCFPIHLTWEVIHVPD